MRIGILTMYYESNYGGVLQSYALYKTLQKIGHDVVVIDYHNSGKRSFVNVLNKIAPLLFRFLHRILTRESRPINPLNPVNLEKFQAFKKKYIIYSGLVDENSIEELSLSLDSIVVGSDQIWNDVHHSRLTFYLDWAYQGRKVAFSACTILHKAPNLLKNKIANLLTNFDSISVRDQNTADFVEHCIKQRPPVTCDPTCLHDFQEFVNESPFREPYILVYILGNDIKGGGANVISMIKEKYGTMKVVSILVSGGSAIASAFTDEIITDASPSEWVNYFAHASIIYTDSFHGIMFAMKFHKDFICYVSAKSRKSRLVDIQRTYGLSNIVSDIQDAKICIKEGHTHPNYDTISPKWHEIAVQSREYLAHVLVEN